MKKEKSFVQNCTLGTNKEVEDISKTFRPKQLHLHWSTEKEFQKKVDKIVFSPATT
mgnify:CR=1 FL=1